MIESHFDIATKDGAMTSFSVHPDGPGPFPAVVFYMDAPGIREELYVMARRIAEQGYYVILPDLFYRFGMIRFPVRNDYTSKVWRACMANMTNAMLMDDTRAMLDHMDALKVVKPGAKGCIGYCMSGRFITCAAGTFPDIFKASASLYGVGIVTDQDDSSHYMVKHITGEIYFGFAETDATVPSFVHPTLQAELKKHGTNAIFEVHPGTRHGFCFESRDVYDKAAAEKVWDVFFDICKRNLG
ncbi:MAG: hypothetical protein CFH40_00421 [Alphaproteobacteria bacterium MarineAlpha10_Bin3]|jgi:carboxymethylenebutenolidase|nr:MAG: hypothetical protein CFH40_00421 [Alphaproteobacteria bacterium MarineAlpha10_Bin3]PPR74908.1 MAG: hypothetical protein CFH09_00421 [Alphaproteobacteria bacterium MarineAlpha4_Bin1]